MSAPNDTITLSELTLPPDRSPSFSAGHRVAAMHRTGLTHGGLRSDRTLFNPSTGVTFLVDHTTDNRSDIEPDRMFHDIAMVRETLGEAYFRGFLAGYARTSYLVTDPGYPGYTDAFLIRARSPIRPLVKATPPVFTDDQCDSLLTPALDLASALPSVKADFPHNVIPEDDLPIVKCAMLMVGVKGAERLRGAAPPLGTVGRLLDALERDPRPNDDGQRLVPTPKALRALDHEPVNPEMLLSLAGMVDVIDWLALRLDRSPEPSETAFVNSVRASQLSLMILQHKSWPTSELESMELKITSRHRYLNWYSYMLSASPNDPRYLHVFTYLSSRVALYQRMFLAPPAAEKVVGRLWSASWRALSLLSTALHRLLMTMRCDPILPVPPASLSQVATILATKTAQVAHDQFLGLTSVPTFFAPYATRGFSENPLVQLVHCANDILRVCPTDGGDLAAFVAGDQVSAMLDKTDPTSFDDFDKDASRGIDLASWERDGRTRFGPDWTPRYRRFDAP